MAYQDIFEFVKEDTNWTKLLEQRSFTIQEYPHYPGIKGNYCTANYINSFFMDQSGQMYKYWNDIGNLERTIWNILNIAS